MGRLVRPPFHVYTLPSVYVTEPKLPVSRSGQLGSLPGHLPGFRRTIKTSPFPCGCHNDLPLKGIRGSSADYLGQDGHPSSRLAIIAGCATPFEPFALDSEVL